MQAQKGFSLIELMIVIAIIGILASVAVPQYQDYVLRTDATNTLSVARPLQLAVGEYAARYSSLPSAGSDLTNYTGISSTATDHAAGKISQIAVGTGGVLTLTFGGTADTTSTVTIGGVSTTIPKELAATTYDLVPTINTTNGVVTWSSRVGTTQGIDPKYLPQTK